MPFFKNTTILTKIKKSVCEKFKKAVKIDKIDEVGLKKAFF